MKSNRPNPFSPSRRGVLRSLAGSSILLPGVVSELLAADAANPPLGGFAPGVGVRPLGDPLAPRTPHFPAKAKRVIFLYMSGGVSHVDSFDHKPALLAEHGNAYDPAPNKTGGVNKKKGSRFLKRSGWDFKPRGNSGTMVSDLFPRVAACADDLCVINAMHGDHNNHFEATLGIHTGSVTFTRPSIGSWMSYGLGTLNQNLPGFVVIAPQLPYAGGQVWGSDFLPPCHQGVRVVPGPEPIPAIGRRLPSAELQSLELGMLKRMNESHLASRNNDGDLAARIRSFETAAGMQQEAPDAFDVSKESDATLALYGLPRGSTKGFAWQCLVARRLAERGVRFIELIDTGSSGNWDSHSNMADHGKLAQNVDGPIAALLQDLKGRGMLDETLVVWTTEFGRTPYADTPDHKGREHHTGCFSSWMAGGGVRGGMVHGVSDEFGVKPAENGTHVHDFHATILHLMGLDHERLTYRHAGRDYRLTDVAGNVVREVLA